MARLRLALACLALLALGGCERARSEAPAPAPALAETAPAQVEQLCAEPVRAWAVLDAQGAIVAETRGACLGVVEHPEDGPLYQFLAQYQDRGAAAPSWELHTWLDVEGAPRYAEFRTSELVTRFAWRAGELSVRRLGDTLRIPEAAELWVVPDHGLYLRELMLRLGVGRREGALVQRAFVPQRDALSELALTLEYQEPSRARARLELGELELSGAERGLAGLRVEALRSQGELRYWPASEAELGPSLPARPRPRYSLPEGLALTPVTIGGAAGDPQLAGELVSASAAPGEAPARRPALLFVGGAGPQDRHGFVPESSVDIGSHEIHDLLAAAGFVVLRVDDRGVGQSSLGDDVTPGFDALVDDARRAWRYLAARPEVDPDAMFLIGHGEGALVASILASERICARGCKHRLRGLVLLAAPARNLRELVYDEIRASMVGRREGEIRTAVDRARRVHDAALADDDLPASSEHARRWMVEAFAEDPLARLAKVRAPVLALQGGKDFQVSAEHDFEPIAAQLEQRGAEGSHSELFPQVDHLFKPEPGVSTPGHYGDLRRHLDPAVLQRILTFVEGSLN